MMGEYFNFLPRSCLSDGGQFNKKIGNRLVICSSSRLSNLVAISRLVALQRTVKKSTKIYNARAQPLFCSLHLLLGDVK